MGTETQDPTITLDIGLDTTGGVLVGIPPVGVHKFGISEMPEINHSTDGEVMVIFKANVIESQVPDSMGATHRENLVIPGEARKASDRSKWDFMMKMLRMKLEAITGRPFRENNLQFKPSEFVGCQFVARCYHEENKAKDGSDKTYINSRLTDWQAILNTAQQSFGAMPTAQPGNGGFGGFGNPPVEPVNPAHEEPF